MKNKHALPGETAVTVMIKARILAKDADQGARRIDATLLQHTQKQNPQSPLIDYTIIKSSTVDPEAMLRLAEDSLGQMRWHETVEAIAEYGRWRIKGGYEPHQGDHRADCVMESLATCLSNIDLNKAAEHCSRGG